MARKHYLDVIGTIGPGNLTNSATSHTFTAPLTYGGNATVVPTLAGSDYFLLSVLTAAGAVQEVIKVTAYNSGTGVATIARAQEGTSGTAATSGDKVTLAAYPSDLDAGILAVAVSGAASTNVATTSATMADVDATNLKIDFIAPASGKVLVTLHGWVTPPGTPGTIYNWGLRESTTTVGDMLAIYGGSVAKDHQIRVTVAFLITGLTPGSSHTYKWAHRLSTGSVSCGLTYGAGIESMVVQAVPA